jgi:hypothetical protein
MMLSMSETLDTGLPAKRIVICQLCRRRLHRQGNGEWYHNRNASVFCDHHDGSRRRALPLEIEVSRRPA